MPRSAPAARRGLTLGGARGRSSAEVPPEFHDGDKLTAKGLNDAFVAMDRANRLARGWFGEQNASVSTDGDLGAWSDVPGLTVTTELLDDGTTLDVTAYVDVTAQNATNPSAATATNCSLRVLVDGEPVGAVAQVQVNSPFSAIPFLATLLTDARGSVDAGTHEVKVQIPKNPGAYAGTRCVGGGATFFARGALRVRAGKD